ncbi:hypothetical protein [Desulfocicer niacini]
MNKFPVSTVRIMVFLLGLSLLSGCALLPARHHKKDLKAIQAADKVRQFNQEIITSRGTGNLFLTRNGKTETYRMAWVANWPDCLRMTLLSSGIPVETIAADGKTLTFVSHTGKHSPHTINRPNPSLKPILSLPVKVKDIIAVLTGKIPLKGGNNVSLHTVENNTSRLVFKNGWGLPMEKIFFNETGQVTDYWKLSSDGPPVIKLHYAQFNRFDSYPIAQTTVLTDSHNRQLGFQITSFSPNIIIKNKDRLFHLTEPGS